MTSDDNFQYVSSPSTYVCGFNYRIEFNWFGSNDFESVKYSLPLRF
jgi:hypothetical protein